MGLALDEPGENDERIEKEDLLFIVEKRITNNFSEIKVDFRASWFGKGFVVNAAGASFC